MGTTSSQGEIRRRWNAPPEITYAKNDLQTATVYKDEIRGGIELGLSPGTIQRIREGRMCARCLEPLEVPWQEKCLCPRPVKKEERLSHLEFVDTDREAKKGKDWGSTVDLEKEVDRLDEEVLEWKWREHPTLGIVVPRKTW